MTVLSKSQYISRILQKYLRLPETPDKVSRSDWQLAERFYEQQIPPEDVEAALILGSARRLARDSSAPRLSSIKSLKYFVPVIMEVMEQPLPNGYTAYLENIVRSSSGHRRNHDFFRNGRNS
ncbi:hypothetical protein L0222_27745 [bacterium]|nr:hypothetical protein [bacterium]